MIWVSVVCASVTPFAAQPPVAAARIISATISSARSGSRCPNVVAALRASVNVGLASNPASTQGRLANQVLGEFRVQRELHGPPDQPGRIDLGVPARVRLGNLDQHASGVDSTDVRQNDSALTAVLLALVMGAEAAAGARRLRSRERVRPPT